ncbi:MAG: hypothetical protein OXG36_07205 [Caldilineaceae bacterium]|nr:hypothetical protein [Caldilineaceae bacterium]
MSNAIVSRINKSAGQASDRATHGGAELARPFSFSDYFYYRFAGTGPHREPGSCVQVN